MWATGFYQRLRDNGDVFIAFSLAGCLILRNWTLTILCIYLFLIIASSSFLSIKQSIQNYNFSFFKTYAGIYYNLKIVFLISFFFLLNYHADGLAGMETPLKSLLAAYVIVLNIDRFRWEVLVRGAAVGAISALVFGLLQIGIYVADRSAGATNPIRFGMIATALAMICAVGVLHTRSDRITKSLSFAGFLCGIGAAFMSGSRGALLALPFVLVLLAPILWQRSRRIFVAAVAFLALFTGVLILADVGKMSTRIDAAFTNIAALVTGGNVSSDHSVGDRTKLLVLAYDLFSEHPLLGVGANGWNEAVRELYDTPDPAQQIVHPYNQAHNQYADDLAKGGIVRFLMNFVLLFLPLYLFLKAEPYSGGDGSPFALTGVVVSVAFMVFCLTESLMILSLPAVVHTTLIFSLLAACDRVQPRVASRTAEASIMPDRDKIGAL